MVNVDAVIFSGNTAPGGRGGAIYISMGNVNVTNSLFQNNGGTNSTNGGAIYNNGGSLTISSSSFLSNSPGFSSAGGAIFNAAGTFITNSTFYGNNGGSGSAIYNTGGNIVITNSTISGNTGGAFYNGSSASVYNSILANTTGGPDCLGAAFNGSSNNIIESWSGCTPPFSGADPGVVGPGSYGGPTPTLSISGGPAYNTGNGTYCPATDQRGVARPQNGACDIGAFEYDTTPPTVTINQAGGQADPTSVLPVNFTAVFSEPIGTSTFTSGDIFQNGSATGLSWSIVDFGRS